MAQRSNPGKVKVLQRKALKRSGETMHCMVKEKRDIESYGKA